MGLFTAATMKASQPELDEHEFEPEPEPEPELDPPPVATACDLAVSSELESAVDVLWSQLRRRSVGDEETAGQAFLLAHWEPREGATTLVTALAHRAAELDPACSFCLADFDFSNNTGGLSYLTNLEAERGVSNILMGQASLEEALADTRLPNLCVLPAGYPNVGRRITQLADRCQELCQALTRQFDYLLLDMPSLRDQPNFAFWASGLAKAVLVVRAGQARRPAVAKAVRILELMRLEVTGVVLNDREFYVPKWLYSRT